jgi:hypothetical protein
VLAVTPTAQESVWLYQRSCGFVLCEGIYESFFDLHGGYFDHPRLLGAIAEVRRALENSTARDRSSIAQILVVADNLSPAYGTFQIEKQGEPTPNRMNEALVEHQIPFIKSGAPYDSVLLGDLDKANLGQYKLVVFLNTWQVDEGRRQMIREKVLTPGRTVLWCYAPGYFKGNRMSEQFIEELTGFHIVGAGKGFVAPQVTLNEQGRKHMEQFGEQPPQKPFGMEQKVCELFAVQDPDARPLGTLPGTDRVTLAWKEVNGSRALYSITSVLTPAVVRALARSAGVHIFATGDDTLYANRSYLAINGGSAGNKLIRLPGASDVYDALSERLLYKGVSEFEASLMYGETQLFRYEPAKETTK